MTKGQIKPKADWRTVDSPKDPTNFKFKEVLDCKAKTKKQTNLFVRFLGESTTCKSAYGFT